MATVTGIDGKTYTLGSPEYTQYLLNSSTKPGEAATVEGRATATTPPTTQVAQAPIVSVTTNTTTPYTPTADDQKLIAMGITPEQIQKMNTPEGLDPVSFQGLIGNVENKLKTNNELVTQRGYLIKQLYDNPLTPDEKKALPEDIQRVVDSGDKDTIELQLRLMNDQIAGRANTLSQSIGYLADAYNTGVKQLETQKQQAISTVIDFVGQYGSKAPQVLASLYGPEYLAKLKAMGIDIEGMASVSTVAQDKAKESSSGLGLTPYQTIQLKNQLSDNARQDPNIKDFTAVRAAYETARAAASSNNSAGDIVLMRMLAKITDPTTGVREEEYRTFQDAQGTLPRYGVALTSQMVGKGQLTSSGRETLLNQIKNIYDQKTAAYDNSVNYWESQAADYGLGSPIASYKAPETSGSVGGRIDPNWLTDYNYDRDIKDAKAAIAAGADASAVKARLLTKYKEVSL